ncbi:MAG: alpha/beta hydrolase [Hyphomicrobiaceae bacterium]|nr:alpha/beta hydrolase [Hyphomicrobiaceae bacterium]
MQQVDFIEAGSGPLVVLVHSSVASARQWRRLIEVLQGSNHVIAAQLFGYGATPPWTQPRKQTLQDQAALVESIIEKSDEPVDIVGHSFGGAVAMKVAANLGSRVRRLVLLEPNPFDLLRQAGRVEAYREVQELRETIKTYGAADDWMPTAECFANYWGGSGTWAMMDQQRRDAFATALEPNIHEWDAIMDETTALSEWDERLPSATTVVFDPETLRPIRELVPLVQQGTRWHLVAIPRGGHMAPLAAPEIVNPIILSALKDAGS